MKKQTLWQRFGGHLVLAGLTLLFISGVRVMATDPLLNITAGVETAVSTPPTFTPPEPLPATPAAVPTVDIASLPVLQDSSLVPAANPLTYQSPRPDHNFEQYEVQRGDTPGIIAAKFGIDPATLLGGNPQLSDESNRLQAGAVLTILPVDGVLHTVQPGESLESIAAQHDVSVDAIISYPTNRLEFPYRLYPETQLLIPGARPRVFTWNPPQLPPGQRFAVVGTGTFVWPVSGRCMTNGYWLGHPAIDIAMASGSSVVAMDRGTVTYASWAAGGYYDYGNLIVVNHGNGYETLYAHLSAINVLPGQVVNQGDYIGATGNTGRSSGPHIHFEIRINGFQDNPLNYLGGGVRDCTG